MAITTNAGRQYPLTAKVAFTYADLTDATAVPAVDVPGGAIVTGGVLVITTAFNSATSDTIAVGDGTNVYLAATNVAATGGTLFTAGGPAYAAPDTVDLTWDGTGTAPSAGAGYVLVTYVIDGRSNEVNP